MKVLRFKNPLIANAHMITQITNQIDPGTKVYFHIDWVKPGKHTFLVNHDNELVKMEPESEAPKGVLAMFGIKPKEDPKPKGSPLKKSKSSFYVHHMLANERAEVIPKCKLTNTLSNGLTHLLVYV